MKIFIYLFLLLNLSACTNPYAQNYVSFSDFKTTENNQEQNIEPIVNYYNGSETEVVERTLDYLRKDYVPIGASEFYSSYNYSRGGNSGSAVANVSSTIRKGRLPKQVKKYGKQLGAEIILAGNKHISTSKDLDSQTNSYTDKTVYYTTTTNTYYNYAVFFRKNSKQNLGIFVGDLNSEQKTKIESNCGVEVRAISESSIAYKNDLLENDIILKLNNKKICSRQEFYKEIEKHKDKSVNVILFRNNRIKSLKLK